MEPRPVTHPTFARELLDARAALGVADAVGLAVRAERRRLGLSQRAYAAHRGWSPSRVSRLEAGAGSLKLADVAEALDGTAFQLALCRRPADDESGGPDDDPDTDPTPGAAALPVPVPVAPEEWARVELVARVRDGSRRFPAHHETEQVSYPPEWWWNSEATRSGARSPHWYAPRRRARTSPERKSA